MPVAKERLEILQTIKLLQCCHDDDRELMTKLCSKGVPMLINYTEPMEGLSALALAAKKNNEELMRHLLSLHAQPDVVDFKGRSPAMIAAELGNVECFELLCRAGADMRLKDNEDKGVLWYLKANTQRHAKILDMSLEYGADVNNQSNDGKPVFVEMCEQADQNEAICLELLKRGAEPDTMYELRQFTPLMGACKAGNRVVVQALLDAGANVNALDKWKTHAAHFAAQVGALGCLAVLSGYGAAFNLIDLKNKLEKNFGGHTPLHYAAQKHAKCCRFLIQRGVNAKVKSNSGQMASGYAKDVALKPCVKECRKGERIWGKTGRNTELWAVKLHDWLYFRQEQLMMEFKSSENNEDELTGFIPKEDFLLIMETHDAPLPTGDKLKHLLSEHQVSRDSGIDYVKFISSKKFLNKRYLMTNYDGQKKKRKEKPGKKPGNLVIPLPIACRLPQIDALPRDPNEDYVYRHIHYTNNLRWDRDNPPAHSVQEDSYWYVKPPDRTYTSLCDAAKAGDFQTVKASIESGVPIDTCDQFYKTPLMVACAHGNLKMVNFLLNNGASLSNTDNFKWTPLHHACHAGQVDIAELLLKKGAEIDAKALNGATPLLRAIETSSLPIIKFLLEKGANLLVKNQRGLGPLEIAFDYADPRIHKLVMKKIEAIPPPPKFEDPKKKRKRMKVTVPVTPKLQVQITPKLQKTAQSALDVPLGSLLKKPDAQSVFLSDDHLRTRKGSILRAASALASGHEDKLDITFIPAKVWTPQASTEKLLCEKRNQRERFGWLWDFPEDFKMPFSANVKERVEIVEKMATTPFFP